MHLEVLYIIAIQIDQFIRSLPKSNFQIVKITLNIAIPIIEDFKEITISENIKLVKNNNNSLSPVLLF